MGWFTNDQDKNKQESNYYTKVNSQSTSSSTTRECKDDPENNQLLLCKEKTMITKWINGKKEQKIEQKDVRYPKSQNTLNPNNNLFSFGFNNNLPIDRNFEKQFQDMWKDSQINIPGIFSAFFSPNFIFHNPNFHPNFNPETNHQKSQNSHNRTNTQNDRYYFNQKNATNNSKIYDL